MRVIKFRAWHKYSEEMDYWDEVKDWGAWALNRACDGPEKIDDDYIVMQYTGLHDKNSKEIYEGDILLISNHIGVSKHETVIWKEASLSYCIHDYRGEWADMSLFPFRQSNIEVIGNIYENPELLKEAPCQKNT